MHRIAHGKKLLADFIDELDKLNISRAIWSYKQMDFGLVDGDGQVIDEEYLRIACKYR